MGDGDDRSLVLLKMHLQPLDRFSIQVVGGLIEQQDFRFLQKQAAQGDPSPFTTRKVLHHGVGFRAPQGIHGPLKPAVKIPCAMLIE